MSSFGYGGDKSVYTKVGGHDWDSKNWYKSDYYYARLEKIRKKKTKELHALVPLNITDD